MPSVGCLLFLFPWYETFTKCFHRACLSDIWVLRSRTTTASEERKRMGRNMGTQRAAFDWFSLGINYREKHMRRIQVSANALTRLLH